MPYNSTHQKAVIVLKTPAERLRQQFRSLVLSQHLSADDPVLETILIADGMYFGRRFCLAGYSLTYFAQEEQIKISSPTFEVIYSASLEQFLGERWDAQEPAARAA